MASHGDFLVVLVGTAHAWCAWRCSAAAAAVHAMAQEKRKREREKHDRQLADSDRFDVTQWCVSFRLRNNTCTLIIKFCAAPAAAAAATTAAERWILAFMRDL
eukprot:17224-Heterococcus_DN1.PRE.1